MTTADLRIKVIEEGFRVRRIVSHLKNIFRRQNMKYKKVKIIPLIILNSLARLAKIFVVVNFIIFTLQVLSFRDNSTCSVVPNLTVISAF